jgi:voltage-gated potassium channel
MTRYSSSLRTFANVFNLKKEELAISLVIMLIVLVFASTLIYHAEHQVQPDKFSSIPDSMWWATATLTTIGYGDIYPITPIGKILGVLISLTGIGIFALPASILASGFIEEMGKKRHSSKCPHCGKELH